MSEQKSSRAKPVDLSPLPSQKEDYTEYEEVVVRWDRILLAGLVIFALIIIIYLALFDRSEEKDTLVAIDVEKAVDATESPAAVASVVPMAQAAHPDSDGINTDSPKVEVAKTNVEKVDAAKVEDAKVAALTEPTRAPVVLSGKKDRSEAVSSSSKHDGNPVRISSAHISRAQLTLGIKNKRPTDQLGQQIEMNEEGIIKVIFYTEMQDLRGQTLLHQWYRNGKLQAEVKIPVNVSPQHSSSSKFINRQMLGHWYVKVTDPQRKVLAEANFNVVKFKTIEQTGS